MKRGGSTRRAKRTGDQRRRGGVKDKATNTVNYVTDSRCREGKHGFFTKEEAKRAIKLARGHDRVVLKKAYKCQQGCGLWHVTSMSYGEYQERLGNR